MTLVYLDTETTGLDPERNDVWEAAFAVDDGPITSGMLSHSEAKADPEALKVGGYYTRGIHLQLADPRFERILYNALYGATVVGANPAFDTAFLRHRWDAAPWKYRLLDIEAYAMPLLGYERPQGLKTVAADLTALGWAVGVPNHTALRDVMVTRACHRALQEIASKGEDA